MARSRSRSPHQAGAPLTLDGSPLSICDLVDVSRYARQVGVRESQELRKDLAKSAASIASAVQKGKVVYGVNTGFGALSGVRVADPAQMRVLQANLLWFLKAGSGGTISEADVRAGMLLRLNCFVRHRASGIRWEIIQHLERFLNEGVTPVVHEFGSIGASGDLVPLSSIGGALIGLDDRFKVDFDGERLGARQALKKLGLKPIVLEPKEGLALVNGTSISTGIAANCVHDARALLSLSMGIHALLIQALNGMVEYFEPFIHEAKPHPGQIWAAAQMRRLLKGSKLTSKVGTGKRATLVGPTESRIRRLLDAVSEKAGASHDEQTVQLLGQVLDAIDDKNGDKSFDVVQALRKIRANVYDNLTIELRYLEPAQDRYSLRCLPQFMGPICDGLKLVSRQIETEMNSANDNPLIDPTTDTIYHSGNFLGQYTAVGMDQLRYQLGLLARHVDSQIALLVEPEFSAGLPPSLVARSDSCVNSGLKGLQIAGNSIAPIISYLGSPIADRFPSHAEQFNQNINSLSFPSANLTRQSIEAYRHYVAIALMFGVQGVDLRSHQLKQSGDYDAEPALSPATCALYHAVREVVGKPPSSTRPYIWNDDEQALDEHIAAIAADVALGERGKIVPSVAECLRSIEADTSQAVSRA